MAGRYELALASEAATVTAELLLPGVPPGRALAAFTDPEIVRSWWTAELTVHLVPGGEYLARFPALGQTMIGVVEQYEPGRLLAFTWGWSHQPEAAGRYGVTVSAEPAASGEGPGTRLEVVHAPRAGAEIAPDDPAPGEHLAGWEHFLPRMAASLTAC
ncbi:SRPBCC domain-containing protein [Actinospica sp. MGRD01-02]|uniref:SRPBCC domain-containing protein n=1 Tax=Actinospica acidithermotolerans TaxID=2828514 RepID=A0A941INF7_9ACTN|nr:SRPBCC family protein [Actinospica acidithermotolerans]MBR7830983.1 SRPBCC domain-containing protein [Actinospica acidithermotolerans]